MPPTCCMVPPPPRHRESPGNDKSCPPQRGRAGRCLPARGTRSDRPGRLDGSGPRPSTIGAQSRTADRHRSSRRRLGRRRPVVCGPIRRDARVAGMSRGRRLQGRLRRRRPRGGNPNRVNRSTDTHSSKAQRGAGQCPTAHTSRCYPSQAPRARRIRLGPPAARDAMPASQGATYLHSVIDRMWQVVARALSVPVEAGSGRRCDDKPHPRAEVQAKPRRAAAASTGEACNGTFEAADLAMTSSETREQRGLHVGVLASGEDPRDGVSSRDTNEVDVLPVCEAMAVDTHNLPGGSPTATTRNTRCCGPRRRPGPYR